jgi:hypothetical protein
VAAGSSGSLRAGKAPFAGFESAIARSFKKHDKTLKALAK